MQKSKRISGGSGGGGGYEYQAQAIAFVCAHILSAQPINWVECGSLDVPIEILVETAGPGDDFQVVLIGGTRVEIQAKRGLSKGKEFWEAIVQLVRGLSIDASLYGALLVDSSTSRTIQFELRRDIKRLGQGRRDNLKAITTELISKLTTHNLPTDASLFARLSIIQADFDQGSPNANLAIKALERVVDPSNRARSAWKELGAEGLNLITLRGKQDVLGLVKALGNSGITLNSESTNSKAMLDAYRLWLQSTTNSLVIPGLGIELPIENAWMRLRARNTVDEGIKSKKTLEEWIKQYHEWERLAQNSMDDEGSIDAEYLLHLHSRAMIVGGPGAGKSTLLKRIAHQEALAKNILFVRLPLVLQRIRMGETFERAIFDIAADGSGIPPNKLMTLASPDVLLADGLDECDPDRSLIVDAIIKWAAGHPLSKVLVTTRPVGHDPSLFTGWLFVEILPFNKDAIQHQTKHILKILYEGEQADSHLKQFEHLLKNNHVASLAARNPLLLSFLILLYFHNIDLGQRRAELYYEVTEVIIKQPILDRLVSIELPRTLARYILEALGWILLNHPGLPLAQVIEKLGADLAQALQISPLAARQKAEQGISYWQERRILEKLTVGYQEAIAFVHLGLAEAAAGRYATQLSNEVFTEWLRTSKAQPRWREVILLTAGFGAAPRVIQGLLTYDDPTNPISTEAILAVAALAEADLEAGEHIEPLTKRLHARLTSPIPYIVFEAATSLRRLGPQAPSTVGLLAQPLVHHSQAWTQIAAIVVTLSCGREYVDVEFVEKCLREEVFHDRHDGWHFWNLFVELGCIYLLETKPEVGRELIRFFLLEGGRINMRTHDKLLAVLRTRDVQDEIIRKVFEKYYSRLHDGLLRVGTQDDDIGEKAWLEAILESADVVEVKLDDSRQSLTALGTLLYSMEWDEASLSDWAALRNRYDEQAILTVFRGAIHALNLERGQVAVEATWLLAQSRAEMISNVYKLPRIRVEPEWFRVSELDIDIVSLVRALRHPSDLIARTAALLIARGVNREKVAELVRDVLEDGDEQALSHIAWLAPHLWEDKALSFILERLSGRLTRGCYWLYSALPDLCTEEHKTLALQAIMRGLCCDNSYIALGAAKALADINPIWILPFGAEVNTAYTYWTERGEICETHGLTTPSGSCPECHIVPDTPRAELIKTLFHIGFLGEPDLLSLCHDSNHHIHQVATELLMKMMSNDIDTLTRYLISAKDGTGAHRLLAKMLVLPKDTLRKVSAQLVDLMNSPFPGVRTGVLRSFKIGWIEREEAIQLASRALQDDDVQVRNQALVTLRSLMHT